MMMMIMMMFCSFFLFFFFVLHLQPDDTVLMMESSTRYECVIVEIIIADTARIARNRNLQMRITRRVLLSIDATNARVAALKVENVSVTVLEYNTSRTYI